MPYQVRTEQRSTAGLDGTVYVLEETGGAGRVEIWPALGFNCYHWQATYKGKPLQLLYADPQLFNNGRPTRSGIPILFPFPNRIRAGHFTWEGKTYQLPLNDSSLKNAIHGFPVRKPWRVAGQGADDRAAWLAAEFRASVDAPEALALWPADYQIRITYRLMADRLRLEARVENPDRTTLPFGLGYHPYFHLPLSPAGKADDCLIECKARSYWELQDGLPTGQRKPVDVAHDLNRPRPLKELNLDDVVADLPDVARTGPDGLCLRGRVRDSAEPVELQLLCSPAYREMVLFTPAHHQAVCIEPYTSTTDAINLQQQGVDAGLLVLRPGEVWNGVVEMVLA
jgi:aldose 1-epimerase